MPSSSSPARRSLTVLAVLLVLGLVVGAGVLLRAQRADVASVVTSASGQSDAVCTVGVAGSDGSAGSASPTPAAPTSVPPSAPLPTPTPAVTPSGTPAPGGTPSAPGTSPGPGGAPSPSGSPSGSLSAPATASPTTGPDPSTLPSTAPTPAPLPSETAQSVSGTVVAVASGTPDASGADPAGRVTLSPLGATAAGSGDVTIDRQGRGATLGPASSPVLLRAEGALATTAVGGVLTRAVDGPESGLEGAPCLVPSTSAWLPGIASGPNDRTELVLSNPDDAAASVDLAFYGRNGRVAVPGSAGTDVPARSSRSVSLSSLVEADGPLTLSVTATSGRVAAAARRIRTDGDKPAGADWVVPATGPATSVVVPAVPGDDGARELVVTNPGERRTTVRVLVLGLQGPFAPAGAETLDLPPQSSGTLALADGLAGTGSGVSLTSDEPVTAAVVSTSARDGAQPDVAVQPATPALVRTGVSAVATAQDTGAELVVSNAAADDVSVRFSVRSLDGVELRGGDILLAAGGSATRRLAADTAAYVVVRVPDGSSVVGGVDLSQSEGDVAGLASFPLVSPDTSGPPAVVEQDPGAGR